MECILAAALDAIREESKLEDRWTPAQLYSSQGTLAHFVDTQMDRTSAHCRLSIFSGSVFLDFSLPHANELPSMDNRFWARLSEAIDHCGLSYKSDENLTPASKSKANREISKFVKAPLFAFLTEFHIAYQNDPGGQLRLGRFEKPIFYSDSSWSEIIRTFSEIFTIMSRLSQSLYRSFYIKASRDPKRRLSVADLPTVNAVFAWICSQEDGCILEDASAAFPDARKIDVQAAHDLALEQRVINKLEKPCRGFVRICPR